MKRLVLFALVLIAFLVTGTSAPAQAAPSPPTITWSRDTKEPRWVTGSTIVDTPPDRVWSKLEGVAGWPAMFTDIKTMKIKLHVGRQWRLVMQTNTFDCGAHDYDVVFQNDRVVRVRILAPGVDAIALVSVRPGPTPEQSIIGYRLFVDAHGVVGWFVSEAKLRERQESMTVRYLIDLHRAFTPTRPPA